MGYYRSKGCGTVLSLRRRYGNSKEEAGKEEKCLGFENLIGKATGQFIETHLHGNLSDLSKSEKLEEIKRLKSLQAERLYTFGKF